MDFDHSFDFDLDFAYNMLVFNPILDPCLDVRLVSSLKVLSQQFFLLTLGFDQKINIFVFLVGF